MRDRSLREKSTVFSDLQPLNIAVRSAMPRVRSDTSALLKELQSSNMELISETDEVSRPVKLRLLSEEQPLSMACRFFAFGMRSPETLKDTREVQPSQRLSRLSAWGMSRPDRSRVAMDEHPLNIRAMLFAFV